MNDTRSRRRRWAPFVVLVVLGVILYSECGGDAHRTARDAVDPRLTALLPLPSELPASVSDFLGNSEIVTWIGIGDPPSSGWDPESPVERPGRFGLVEYVANKPAPDDIDVPSIQIRLWKQHDNEAARAFWQRWVIPLAKVHGTGLRADTANSESEIRAAFPKLTTPIRSTMDWQLFCISPGPGFYIQEATGCMTWVAWTHFCQWNLNIELYAPPRPWWPIRDRRIVTMAKDVAASMMNRLKCEENAG